MVSTGYPWYAIINDDTITQGEIVNNCPIIRPNIDVLSGKNKELNVVEYDTIVMSQSCDLENNKLELVVVCPIFSLDEINKKYGGNSKETSRRREGIRKGQIHHLHLLNKHEGIDLSLPISVVDFSQIYSLPVEYLKELLSEREEERLRLLPPYREHLSQSFAKYFMRVGLPSSVNFD